MHIPPYSYYTHTYTHTNTHIVYTQASSDKKENFLTFLASSSFFITYIHTYIFMY